MADLSVQGMRYEITGDISKLSSAFRKAEAESKEAGEAMAEQFERASFDAGQAIDAFVTRAMRRVAVMANEDAAAGFVSAWRDASGAAEGAVTAGFDKARSSIDGVVTGLLSKLPGHWGKIAQLAWAVFKEPILEGVDNLKPAVAEKLEGLITPVAEAASAALAKVKSSITSSLQSGFAVAGIDEGKLQVAQTTVESWADAIQFKLDDLATGARTALQKLAGTFDGITDAVQKALDAVKGASDRQVDLFGQSVRRAAELRTEFDLLARAGKKWSELTNAETQAMAEQIKLEGDRAEFRDEETKARQADREYERTIAGITTSLQRQVDMERASADAITKTAAARAMERAQAQAMGYRNTKGGSVIDDPRVQGAINAAGEAAGVAAQIKFNTDLTQTIKLQSEQYMLQARSLGATAGEAARMKVVQDQLNAAQRLGVPITDALRSTIDAAGLAIGRAAQQAAEAQQRFRDLMQVGTMVASNLESAFDRWMSGTKMSFKSFINELSQDLAKLAFKSALMPIFGGGATPGGGLFGTAMSSLFGLPGRAGGGPVSGGSPYMVGEKGPELFVPRSAGTIVPNGAMGGRGATTINMRINLEGANGDETIARISSQAARQAAMAAVQHSSDSFGGRSRQFRMMEG
jgi:hypothetical protein